VPAAEIATRAPLLARSFHGTLIFHQIAGAVLRLEPAPQDPESMARRIVQIYLPGEGS
jgi:hypothetical protein